MKQDRSFVIFIFSLLLLGAVGPSQGQQSNTVPKAGKGDDNAADIAFRNSVDSVPPGWNGPVFKLSHDYPDSLPEPLPMEEYKWLKRKVRFWDPAPKWDSDWKGYLNDILEYVKKGQDPHLRHKVGWRVAVDGETRWYHMPWMAYDPSLGREFIHGTTSERIPPLEDYTGHSNRAALGREKFETWAVGVYNRIGGYSIGQIWPVSGEPQITNTEVGPLPKGLPFQEGTVVAKVLFSTVTPNDVPFLNGSPEWVVNRHIQLDAEYSVDRDYTCKRKPQPVHLVQVDVAVVDERSPSRWVFGTFAYDGRRQGDSVWDRLEPLGLQWGNDSETFPAVPMERSLPARQSVLAPTDIYEHFGCNGRLAGPVDNRESSCLTCHGASFTPRDHMPGVQGVNIPAIFGFPGICDTYSPENAAMLQTIAFPQRYSGGRYPDAYHEAIPLDYSLQLQAAFTSYGYFHTQGEPPPCTVESANQR